MYNSLIAFKILRYLIFMIPISLVLGSVILNINLILILLSFSFLIIFNKDSRVFFKSDWVYVGLIIYFFQIVSTLVNEFYLDSLIRSMSFIKFIILAVCLDIVFCENKKNLENFLKILFVVLVFILIDSSIQYYFGKNLLGYPGDDGRLTSIFNNEYIVGSFISKVGFLVTPIFLKIFIKQKYLNFALMIWLIYLSYSVLITGERMASILIIFGTCLILGYKVFQKKRNILYLIPFSLCIISIIFINPTASKRFQDTISDEYGIGKKLNIKDSNWGAHFLTAYEIFKNYPVLGVGPKNFRIESCKTEYNTIDSLKVNQRCTTHPHNILLEILSEHGIVGLICFSFLIFLILKKINYLYEYNIYFVISLIIYIWPIGTSGSIFTSWNGTFLWINIGILSYLGKKKFKIKSLQLS